MPDSSNHHLYSVSGLLVDSGLPLPELRLITGAKPHSLFAVREGRAPSPPGPWFHHWTLPGGEVWLRFARMGEQYLLHFPDIADFVISADGQTVFCYRGSAPESTLRHLFLDQVVPLLLSRHGKIVLHASSVATPAGSLAFAGMSGSGKSTLTASFCRRGFSLLADDGLLLERRSDRILAVPSYPGLRLWPDTLAALFQGVAPEVAPVAHYTDKLRLAAGTSKIVFCAQPVPLRRLYFLAPPSANSEHRETRVTSLSAAECFAELVQYAYRLDITDKQGLREDFERLAGLAAQAVARRLSYPRSLARLPEVQCAIFKDLELDGGRL